MSERHREALAHLLYGVSAGGGFVQLTGEVGTGKTTACRCLLEQLPPEVDVALILNPPLTAAELLAAVCDELRIPYPAETTSLKVLVDALSQYLLAAHARGRRTVLIIDEAQNLPAEVLEQIRLLTNLETATEKLVQVILIGQPELISLLDRRELRQLAQRVTARYHLQPFTEAETLAYIRHRMQVAGQKETIFSEPAMRRAHRLAGGVPRLINVICDRALLGAYAQDRRHVDAMTVLRAAKEVLGPAAARSPVRWRWVAAGVAVVVAVAGGWVLRAPESLDVRVGGASITPSDALPASAAGGVAPARGGGEGRGAGSGARLGAILLDASLRSDKQAAFAALYARWGVEYSVTKEGLGCDAGRAQGLRCLFKTGTWNKLRRFNLPAIIELVTPAGHRHYATVTALTADTATLEFGPRRFTLPLAEVEAFWDGPFILVWKPPVLSVTVIAPGARGKDVDWLRQRLQELDGEAVAPKAGDVYDDELRARVVSFQQNRSLVPDGIVGEETLTHLTTARPDADVPALWPPRP
jgi:general secretion pathway protein A